MIGEQSPWHSRGYLPHFDTTALPQVVTFRLADALPRAVLERWQQELAWLAPTDVEMHVRRRIEHYLDQGHGSRCLGHAPIGRLVEEALLHFDGVRYRVHAWVVMPNHVHVLLTLCEGEALGKIVHAWKSYTATQSNRLLGRTGSFWQREYFDRCVRDERHYGRAMVYIEGNPVAAGLCVEAATWPFSSARFARDEACRTRR